MAIYLYKVKNQKGLVQKGSIEATDKYKAVESLQNKGLILLYIKESEDFLSSRAKQRKRRFRLRLKLDDLASLARQLATLLDAGVPLLRSLEIVKEQAEVKSLYNALEAILKDVESGQALSKAIAKHPKIFSAFWVNLITTGETSGQLPFVLVQLSQYMESSASLQRRFFSALIYPFILSIAASLALTVFITIVIPMFSKLYSYFGSQLPYLTRLVIALSAVVKRFLFLFLVVTGGIIFALWRFKLTDRGQIIFDTIKIRLPLVKLLFFNVTVQRFSSGLAMLLKSGVPILYSLEVVSKAVANRIYEGIILKAREKVKGGESLANTLESYPREFPPFVTNMIKVGEESGNLPTMLEHVSNFYQEKVETVADRLPYIVEPLIILTIGGVIGIMVIAMFLPIFGIATAVQM